MSGGKVVADAEAVVKWILEGENWLRKGRTLLAEGFTTKPEVVVDISQIQWKLKSGAAASPEDEWAWAFSTDREGKPLTATRQLVEGVTAHGKVQVNGFEITLGGYNGSLLNRRKVD